MYKKVKIGELKNIRGNVQDYNQEVEFIYYDKTNSMPDKVAIYFIWTDKEGNRKAIRSTYFSSVEQFKMFLFKVAKSYVYFMRKRKNFLDINFLLRELKNYLVD